MLVNPWVTVLLIILIGIIGSTIGSLMGSGTGLVTLFLITLVIGSTHNMEAKLIMLPSILILSVLGVWRYIKLKEPPHWKSTFWICLGYLPLSVIGIILISPYLKSDRIQSFFPFIYVFLVILLLLLINFKKKMNFQNVLPSWSLPILGGFVGLLVGSFGIGLLTMTILVVGLKIPLRQAISSFLVIAFGYTLVDITVAWSFHQYSHFTNDGVLWYLPLVILIGSIIGSQIGPLINNKISPKTMLIIFNSIMGFILVFQLIHGSLLIAHINL